MQNKNKGLFNQVLRELELYTYCVYVTSETVAARGRPVIVGATWTGYWLDAHGKGVEVHAVDKSDGVCCECGFLFGDDEDDDENCVLLSSNNKEEEHLDYTPTIIQTPPATPVVPSLADAVGYRPPPKIYQAHEWELCSLSDYEEDFRQTTLASSSSDEVE
jgi:hypothetical protein